MFANNITLPVSVLIEKAMPDDLNNLLVQVWTVLDLLNIGVCNSGIGKLCSIPVY